MTAGPDPQQGARWGAAGRRRDCRSPEPVPPADGRTVEAGGRTCSGRRTWPQSSLPCYLPPAAGWRRSRSQRGCCEEDPQPLAAALQLGRRVLRRGPAAASPPWPARVVAPALEGLGGRRGGGGSATASRVRRRRV